MDTLFLILIYLSVLVGSYFTFQGILLSIESIVRNTKRNLTINLLLAAHGWASFAALLNM